MKIIKIKNEYDPKLSIFREEACPCEHVVQIYEDEPALLNSLQRFVSDGLGKGEGVIALATKDHLSALDERLEKEGHDLLWARARDYYIPLGAEETLAKFMVDGWPHEDLFEGLIVPLLERARGNGRKVRAFGELVAVLWAMGQNTATIRLEHLWHALCQREKFLLWCAYPQRGFSPGDEPYIRDICAEHTQRVAA